MTYIALIIVAVLWILLVIGAYYFVFCPKECNVEAVNNHDRWAFEEMSTIYDNCNALTANNVYFLRIVYGQHNKRFFMPSATCRIEFLDENTKNLGYIEIKPDIMLENHRKYLSKWYPIDDYVAKKQLNVLVKRKVPLINVKHIVLDHSIYRGTIHVYGVYLVNLLNNQVYGAHVDMSINHLEKGFRPEFQRFSYDFFGTYIDYIGPSYNLNLFEVTLFCKIGASFILLYCSTFISCEKGTILCRQYQNLAYTIETAIFASLVSVVATCVLLTIYRFGNKRMNAKYKTSSYLLWASIKYLPYITSLICICLDSITLCVMVGLYPKYEFKTNAIRDLQRSYYIIAVAISTFVYLLAMIFLIQVLLIRHQFDEQELPRIDFETNQIRLPEKEERPELKREKSNVSIRNLKFLSTFKFATSSSSDSTTNETKNSKILNLVHCE